jgi:hypothetical protein
MHLNKYHLFLCGFHDMDSGSGMVSENQDIFLFNESLCNSWVVADTPPFQGGSFFSGESARLIDSWDMDLTIERFFVGVDGAMRQSQDPWEYNSQLHLCQL